jgi:hypothetical protein
MSEDSRIFNDAALPLAGLRIGISGAVPEREHWGNVPDLERLILSFVYQLSALVIKYGGKVVHGCQPLLTPVVAEAASQSAEYHTAPLTLIASQLWGELPNVAARAASVAKKTHLILTPKVGEGDIKDRDTRNQSLTALRLQLAEEIDVLVAVGGKFHSKTGFNPGVLEELAVAKWRGVPCFIVAGFGGLVGSLETTLLDEFSADNLLQRGESGPGAETIAMATWNETVDEYVGKLLAHFARNRDRFISRQIFQYSGDLEPLQVINNVPLRIAKVDAGELRWSADEFDRLRKALDKADIGAVQSVLKQRRHSADRAKNPGVPYRETIRAKAEARGRHQRQTGGHGEYGDCRIRLEPMERGEGFQFVNDIFGGVIPKNFIPAVEKGILEAAASGSLAGYPVVDFRAILYDGSYHDIDSTEHSFEMAGGIAFKQAMEQAKPALLEPIMRVEIIVPEEYVGSIVSDLHSRRGRIQEIKNRQWGSVVKAEVPLAAMMRYAEDLKAMTKGQGSYNMDFSQYEVVPDHIQQKIVAQSKGITSKLQFADEASSEA